MIEKKCNENENGGNQQQPMAVERANGEVRMRPDIPQLTMQRHSWTGLGENIGDNSDVDGVMMAANSMRFDNWSCADKSV